MKDLVLNPEIDDNFTIQQMVVIMLSQDCKWVEKL